MKSYTRLLFLCLFVSFSALAQNKTYYVSPSGNDANNGLTTTSPWRTLAKVNSFDFEPGDQILFEGGQVFSGSLQLQSNDKGTTASPVVFNSYGTGKAQISSGAQAGVLAEDVGGFEIRNLAITGNGAYNNSMIGVEVRIVQQSADLDHVILYGLDVSGYGKNGILIISAGTNKGFNHLRIERCNVFDNGISGIETYGDWPSYSHTDFYIGYCRVYNNLGVPTETVYYTGNGILVSGVDGALIEFCEAFNNGQNNGSPNGGPVGIWVYDAKNAIIQYCESHHNKASGLYDGGGFDIDGGSQNCIIQYCYSHDNDGAGYGLFEYGSPNTFTNNKIRYNISQNDGRKNSYSGFYLWAFDNTHRVTNSEIYNNTVYLGTSGLVNGTPPAVWISSPYFSNVKVRNNIFYMTPGVHTVVSSHVVSTSDIHFQNNNYYSETGAPYVYWGGNNYYTLSAWRTGSGGQEMNGSTPLGTTVNPLLVAPGSGGTVGPATGGSFSSLTGYRLQSGSPMINAGMSFADMGTRDFYGTSIPQGGAYDLGASEFGGVVLPVRLLSFSGSLTSGQSFLKWDVGEEDNVVYYEVQRSVNNIDFDSISRVSALGRRQYLFTDKGAGSQAYYRIKIVSTNARIAYSSILRLMDHAVTKIQAVYRDGSGVTIVLQSDKAEAANIRIFDAQGRMMYTETQALNKGTNLIEVPQARVWPGGTYIIHSGLQTIKFVKQGY
jgi:hypothetical protein